MAMQNLAKIHIRKMLKFPMTESCLVTESMTQSEIILSPAKPKLGRRLRYR